MGSSVGGVNSKLVACVCRGAVGFFVQEVIEKINESASKTNKNLFTLSHNLINKWNFLWLLV